MCMNLTLSIDEKIAQRARAVAAGMGKSLNQLVRDYLGELASGGNDDADVEELRRLSLASGGNRRGWRFDRHEAHERP